MGTHSAKTNRRIHGLDPEQRRELRRQALLETALQLFAADGYANTSVEAICQAASVSTKSFYEVFESREHLYKTLFIELSEQLRDELAAELGHLSDDEWETSARLFDTFVRALVRDPRRCQVLYGAWRVSTPEIELLRRENRRWAAEFIEAVWRHYGVKGDHHGIAIAVVGGLFDLIILWVIDADPTDQAQVSALIDQGNRFYAAVRRGLE